MTPTWYLYIFVNIVVSLLNNETISLSHRLSLRFDEPCLLIINNVSGIVRTKDFFFFFC